MKSVITLEYPVTDRYHVIENTGYNEEYYNCSQNPDYQFVIPFNCLRYYCHFPPPNTIFYFAERRSAITGKCFFQDYDAENGQGNHPEPAHICPGPQANSQQNQTPD